MRWLVTLAATFGFIVSGCSPASEATGRNPCKLLTADQVTQLTGGPVKKALVSSTGASCSYAATGSGKVSLLVTAQSNFSQSDWDTERSVAIRAGSELHELKNIGDKGFAYSAQRGTVQSAQAKHNRYGVQILLTGVGATSENAQAGLVEVLETLDR